MPLFLVLSEEHVEAPGAAVMFLGRAEGQHHALEGFLGNPALEFFDLNLKLGVFVYE